MVVTGGGDDKGDIDADGVDCMERIDYDGDNGRW